MEETLKTESGTRKGGWVGARSARSWNKKEDTKHERETHPTLALEDQAKHETMSAGCPILTVSRICAYILKWKGGMWVRAE